MPTSDFLSPMTDWYQANIAVSQIWGLIGFVTALLLASVVFYVVFRTITKVVSACSNWMASRRRKSQQGYGIGISPLKGPKGKAQTKALMTALNDHLADFSFGAPFEILKAPAPRAKGAKGLRADATLWLERASTDLVLWGGRSGKKVDSMDVEVLSLEGSLAPREAVHSEGKMPLITDANRITTGPVAAYLVARALQPGLATAASFKAEKLAPVAETLFMCLQDRENLPERTQLTLETDYCAMGLHIGGQEHFLRVAELRRKRLSGDQALAYDVEVPARIDLGRALLGLSNIKFDPVRVREAMDHLKAAIDLLRTDPNIRLAQATSNAVQRGQAMLENRKRFSVTGGAGV